MNCSKKVTDFMLALNVSRQQATYYLELVGYSSVQDAVELFLQYEQYIHANALPRASAQRSSGTCYDGQQVLQNAQWEMREQSKFDLDTSVEDEFSTLSDGYLEQDAHLPAGPEARGLMAAFQ
ncbi:Hypothetical_protein [Hexamita inflata]|uniref:Hypothetical_protein n=1 Tax=Hexamita inflata TaxID=28002 RepID=A0AA86RL49_9EUKA|nr:Hypothetical protein HINF_LOCUS56110 [Hexamita inflata]